MAVIKKFGDFSDYVRFLNINGTFKWPYIKNEILLDPKFSPNRPQKISFNI